MILSEFFNRIKVIWIAYIPDDGNTKYQKYENAHKLKYMVVNQFWSIIVWSRYTSRNTFIFTPYKLIDGHKTFCMIDSKQFTRKNNRMTSYGQETPKYPIKFNYISIDKRKFTQIAWNYAQSMLKMRSLCKHD